jgi:preprotein translocase SecE subunit
MAVAVKTPETRSKAAPATVQVLSLVGLGFLLASLVVVFWVIPTYLPQGLAAIGLNLAPAMQATLIAVVMLAAAIGLGFVGTRIFGERVAGVRAGIFTGLCGVLLILGLSSWFGGVVEWLTFDKGLFGSLGKTIGIALSGAFALFLAFMFLRWFFAPGTNKWLEGFEAGGWFSWTSYKPQQGVRVRRGTIIGLLLLAGAGVYTLISHNTLARFDGWSIGVPFTGTIPLHWEYKRGADGKVTEPKERLPVTDTPFGDAIPLLQKRFPDWDGESDLKVDRWVLRDEINVNLDPTKFIYLKLDKPQEAALGLDNGVRSRAEYEARKEKLKEEGNPVNIDEARDTRDPVLAGNPSGRKDPERLYAGDTLQYTPIPILPYVRFTVPLLLAALSLWFAWRLVNYPVFADFLIATEAELNKVSWTTRKRLFQDTIVVLVTVLLMAGFLLIVDLGCRSILGSEWIRVIQINRDAEAAKKNAGPKPW